MNAMASKQRSPASQEVLTKSGIPKRFWTNESRESGAWHFSSRRYRMTVKNVVWTLAYFAAFAASVWLLAGGLKG